MNAERFNLHATAIVVDNTGRWRDAEGLGQHLQAKGVDAQSTAIGTKGMQFLGRINAKVVSHAVHLGDTPHLEKLIGAIKAQLDAVPRAHA